MRPINDDKGRDGAVASIAFLGGAGDAEFHVSLSRDGTKLETSAKIGGEMSVGRVLVYEARSEGQRLSRELGFLSRDKVYEEAIGAVAGMLGMSQTENQR